MNIDPGTFAAVLAALVTFLAGASRASKAVWGAATALRDAIASVEGNTSATKELAGRFEGHAAAVVTRLDDHDQRLSALESGTPGLPDSGTPGVDAP